MNHHGPRFSAHPVRETPLSRIARCLCSVLLCLLLLVGVILFILWLNLRPHRPRFHLSSFSTRSIIDPTGSTNLAISFTVADRNPNHKVGIYYDAMAGSVFYRGGLLRSGTVMFPFYQPPKNTTSIAGQLARARVAAGSSLAAQLSGDGKDGRIGLRLELTSTIRFKVKTWDTGHHRMHVECNLFVSSDGALLPESKNVKCSVYF